MSAHLGEDYKPLKPSDTIKELSDMCFGPDGARDCKPLYPGNPWEPAIKKLADDTRDQVLGQSVERIKAARGDEHWDTIMPEGYRQPAKWPKGCAAVVHGQDGVEWVDAPTDHAAELAEALEYAIKQVPELETVPGIALALKAYKQSRGE